MIWRGGLQENRCWRGGLMFYKWVGNVPKKGGLDKKGVEKKGGRL